jgi:general secretion pathway protein N
MVTALMAVLSCSDIHAQGQPSPDVDVGAPSEAAPPENTMEAPEPPAEADENSAEMDAQPQDQTEEQAAGQPPAPVPPQAITPQRPPPALPQRAQPLPSRDPAIAPRRAQPGIPQRARPVAETPSAQPQAMGRTRRQPPAQKAAVGDMPSLDELAATRERPLFSSTRRPPEAEPIVEASAPITENAPMPFELVGVVVGEDVSAAIFRNTESKEETRVAKGEKIGNWSVEEVAERAVVLRGDDRRVRMRMFNESTSPGIQVGRIGGDDPHEDQPAAEPNDPVDEEIAPTASPEVRPATAQPKPPPALKNKNQSQPRRAARPVPGHPNQPRLRQQP